MAATLLRRDIMNIYVIIEAVHYVYGLGYVHPKTERRE